MADPSHHQLTWTAAGLRRAARGSGVEPPTDYSRRGVTHCGQLGVTKVGSGVVIHTFPGSSNELPIVVGYAGRGGPWYRYGGQHHTAELPVTDPLTEPGRAGSGRKAAS